MPIVTFCFSFASLSMIGLPPFNGFISKWFLALGALESAKVGSYSQWIGISAVGLLILSSFMNLVYYGPIVYGAWFEKGKDDSESKMIMAQRHLRTLKQVCFCPSLYLRRLLWSLAYYQAGL